MLGDTMRVLLITGDPSFADSLRGMLQEAPDTPLALTRADSLAQGRARLAAGGIDAILVDLARPDGPGLEALAALGAEAPDVSIVALTDQDEGGIPLEAVRAGAQDCLHKTRLTGPMLGRVLRFARERQGLRGELARHQHQAQASEAQSRHLIEKSADAILVVDPQGVVRFANPAAAALFGRPSAELLEQPFGFPVLAGETTELDILRRGGPPASVEMRVVAIEWAGAPASLASLRDTTERKRMEEALRKSEERYRRITQTVTDYIYTVRVENGRPVETQHGPGCIAVTGYTTEEFAADPYLWIRIVDEQDREAVLEQGRRVLAGENVHPIEHRIIRKDGVRRWVGNTQVPHHDAQGALLTYDGLIQDITERRQAEEKLFERTRQLEAVRAVSSEITRELDLTTLLDLIDRRAAELVGAASGAIFLWEESVQLLISRAWHGLEDWIGGVRFRLGEGIAGTVAQRRQGLLVNDFRTSPYALPLFLERTEITAVLAKPLLYHDRLLGVIAIGHQAPGRTFTEEDQVLLRLFADHAAIAIENARLYEQVKGHVSTLEQRVLERTQELAAANQQLQAASRHKSEFLANMSHELRTPLNSVLGFAQILLEQTGDILSAKQTRYLTNIYNSGQHLLRLISDVLDLSKVEAGKFVLQPESLPVAATLEDVLVIARGLAYKKGQEIRTDVAPALPALHADPVRFKQILFNLLSNAVKFTPDGGTITVTARRVAGLPSSVSRHGEPLPTEDRGPGTADGFLEISVADTGIGIKPEDLPRLFREFTQLETTQDKRHEGTGLGLALTKRLVELHGGRIWAASEGEGKGSTFTVVLPFAGAGT